MRIIFAFLLTLAACSTPEAPKTSEVPQTPATPAYGKMEPVYSRVQIFLADEKDDTQKFYLILRDYKNRKIDIEEKKIQVSTKVGFFPTFKTKRISKGRYQVIFDKQLADVSRVEFNVQGFPLKKEIENRQKPEPLQGKISLVSKGDHELTLRLTLQNMRGESVDSDLPPGTVVEGGGTAFDYRKLKKGLWEFKVTLPEENALIYVTIRTNGVQLDRLFRYQHIEN